MVPMSARIASGRIVRHIGVSVQFSAFSRPPMRVARYALAASVAAALVASAPVALQAQKWTCYARR